MDLFLFLVFISPVLAVKTGPTEDYYHAAVVEFCPHEGKDGNDTVTKNGLEYVRLIKKAAEVTGPTEDYYHAAVVEFCPHEGKDGNDTVTKNGLEYVRLIKKAAEVADIVVFPEYGLSYEDETIFLEIPFDKNEPAPADNAKLHPVIRMLSKAARDNEIYVSVCFLEKDLSTGKELKYNTNVVFDRKGVVIAKYRKFNLYYEQVNTTKVPDISTFDTDFGVRFGIFICADIFHKEPPLTLVYEKNIRDFIYPNWFYAELKLGLSVQIQLGWAYMTDSNLLSSGINSLEQGSTGSGIFAGRDGPVINIISEKNETRILTGKVYKKSQQQNTKRKPEGRILEPLTPGVESTHEIEPEDFQNYVTHLLTPNLKYEEFTAENGSFLLNKTYEFLMCHNSLCCQFNAEVTFTFKPAEHLNMSDISYLKNDSYYHYEYMFATFDGVKVFPDAGLKGIQVCSIIPCLNQSVTSCWKKTANAKPLKISTEQHGDIFLHSTAFNKILIKSTTTKPNDFTFPYILDSSKIENLKALGSAPDVSKMDFHFDNISANLTYSSNKLIYAGLYSRIISRDGV